jgi:hypothetical protein
MSSKSKEPSEQQPAEQQPAASEDDPEWQNHPAREVLRLGFWSGEIPLDWKRQPKTVYDIVKDREEFKGMPYDNI